MAVPYFKNSGKIPCLAVNISSLGLSGVTDGSNVTLQMAFNGGDAVLYQVYLSHHCHVMSIRMQALLTLSCLFN